MFEYLFSSENQDIMDFISTEEFKLAQGILKRRINLGWSLEDAAEYLKLTPEDYIDYEYGDTNLSLDSYKEVFKKLNDFTETESFKLIDNISSKVLNNNCIDLDYNKIVENTGKLCVNKMNDSFQTNYISFSFAA